MPTTTYTLTPANKRNLMTALVQRAEGTTEHFTTRQALIDYGVDDLGFPEPVVRHILVELERKGYLVDLEVGA